MLPALLGVFQMVGPNPQFLIRKVLMAPRMNVQLISNLVTLDNKGLKSDSAIVKLP